MKHIRLMKHHILAVREILSEEKPNALLDVFATWVFNRVYGRDFVKNYQDWIRSLDPNDTSVEVVPDRKEGNHFQMNVDDLCKIGCPFYHECETHTPNMLERIVREKWYVAPLIIWGGLSNHRRTENLDVIEGRYRLSDIL